MAKAFVTGVAGFLGSHVAERFVEIGWDVVGIDNLRGGSLVNVPAGVRFFEADCLNPASYSAVLAGADVVFHCACDAYDGLSYFSPAAVYRNTAQATVEVATAAVASHVSRFVHCSSMARYGAAAPPFTEETHPLPVSPYGLAKHASEQIVANLFSTHGGEYAIAIPHNIIGPRQRYTDPYRNVAAIMINRMLRGLQPVIYGDGSSVRCFSFIDDVLYCLEQMALSPKAAGETINIGPDEGSITILGLAHEIATLIGFPLDPVFVAPRPGEVGVALCSADKARRLLGYRTRTSLTEGLAAMIEWIEQHGTQEFNYDVDLELVTDHTPATWIDKLI